MQATINQLKEFLVQTHADQGGECTFEEFLQYVAEDEQEFGHEEAKQYLASISN